MKNPVIDDEKLLQGPVGERWAIATPYRALLLDGPHGGQGDLSVAMVQDIAVWAAVPGERRVRLAERRHRALRDGALMELHSLRTMRPALLEGPHRPRPRPRRDPWPLIAALVALVLVGLAVRQRRAHGSACPSGHCEAAAVQR